MLIHNFIEKANKLYPNKIAVKCGELELSYGQLYSRAIRFAALLQNLGVKKGEVISILHQNCHYFLEIYFACSFSGVILNSINTRLTSADVSWIFNHSDSKLLITNQSFENIYQQINLQNSKIILTGNDFNQARDLIYYELSIARIDEKDFISIDINESEVAQLYYTSGTTGKPKGVMLTHKNVTVHSLAAIAEFNLSDEDNWLHAAPMFHLADAWASFAITAVGGKHIICPSFDSELVLKLIEEEKITISNLIPTMLNLIINSDKLSDYDLSSLRVIMSGGAPIAPELVKKIIEKFNCDYIQTYGMTETSPYLTVSILKEHLKKLPFDKQLNYKSKTGREFLGVNLKVIRDNGEEVNNDDKEVGEIIVKGDIVTKGYWKMPKETNNAFKKGWFYTGDLATIDKEGYVNIVDRKNDLIITGGEKVYSIEVEYALYEHPDILEVAVIGIPNDIWGESIHAVIVLKQDKNLSEKEIIDFAKQKLASFKVPKSIEFVESLPKTGSGKITKQALKKNYKI